jgi:hypothetical protein
VSFPDTFPVLSQKFYFSDDPMRTKFKDFMYDQYFEALGEFAGSLKERKKLNIRYLGLLDYEEDRRV